MEPARVSKASATTLELIRALLAHHQPTRRHIVRLLGRVIRAAHRRICFVGKLRSELDRLNKYVCNRIHAIDAAIQTLSPESNHGELAILAGECGTIHGFIAINRCVRALGATMRLFELRRHQLIGTTLASCTLLGRACERLQRSTTNDERLSCSFPVDWMLRQSART